MSIGSLLERRILFFLRKKNEVLRREKTNISIFVFLFTFAFEENAGITS
jgi:hypothetical protein